MFGDRGRTFGYGRRFDAALEQLAELAQFFLPVCPLFLDATLLLIKCRLQISFAGSRKLHFRDGLGSARVEQAELLRAAEQAGCKRIHFVAGSIELGRNSRRWLDMSVFDSRPNTLQLRAFAAELVAFQLDLAPSVL